MRFGIQHAIGDPGWVPEILEPGAVTRFARAAEESAWDAIAFTDHPAPSARWSDHGGEGVADPFSALGYCAALTTSIRLLVYVLVPAYRNPFVAAQQVATLDALSGGRVTLGLGTGYLRGEFHAVGADPDQRRSRFDEHLDAMRRAWSGADVTMEGTGYSARGTRVRPQPVQAPHPPLWIHANGPWGRARAARDLQGAIFMVADSVLVQTIRTTPVPDVDALALALADLRIATERAGRDPDALDVVVCGQWPMLDVRTGWSSDRYLDEAAAFAALGVTWTVLTCCGDDPGAAEDTVRAFGEQVVAASVR